MSDERCQALASSLMEHFRLDNSGDICWAMTDPALPVSECAAYLEKTLHYLKEMGDAMKSLKVTTGRIADRWNMVEKRFLLSAKVAAIRDTMPGASNEEIFMALKQLTVSAQHHIHAGDLTLRYLDEQVWQLVFNCGFGKPLPEHVSLTQARAILFVLYSATCEEQFLARLKDECQGKAAQEKEEVVLRTLLEVMFHAYSIFGYEHEDGYLAVHKAMMDYGGDHGIFQGKAALWKVITDTTQVDPASIPFPQP